MFIDYVFTKSPGQPGHYLVHGEGESEKKIRYSIYQSFVDERTTEIYIRRTQEWENKSHDLSIARIEADTDEGEVKSISFRARNPDSPFDSASSHCEESDLNG